MEDVSNSQPFSELSFSSLPDGQRRNKSSQAKHEGSTATNTQRRHSLRVTRASKTTFITVFAFVLCWLPYTLLSITGSLCQACHFKIPPQVYSFLLLMGYLNSVINPVIYSFRTRRFKEAIKGILRNKRRERKVEPRVRYMQESREIRECVGAECLERRTNCPSTPSSPKCCAEISKFGSV